MNKPHLIGLLGYAGSGKDTVFQVAFDLLCMEWQVARFAFADILKHEVAESLGVSLDFLNDNKNYFRETLQHWGQRRREEDPDYWITQLGGSMVGCPCDLAFITDVRHLNEANHIRKAGGLLVRVVRDGVGPANTHESETENELIIADWTINNPGDEGIKGEVERLLIMTGWMEKPL